MDWKQEAIQAFDQPQAELDKVNERQTLKREAQVRNIFAKWLKREFGVDAEVISNRYTHDGVTFVARDLGSVPFMMPALGGGTEQRNAFYTSFHMEGGCRECGKTVLSPPIWDKPHLGALLREFRAEPHECAVIERE